MSPAAAPLIEPSLLTAKDSLVNVSEATVMVVCHSCMDVICLLLMSVSVFHQQLYYLCLTGGMCSNSQH